MILKEFNHWDLYGSWAHTPIQSKKIECMQKVPNTTGCIPAEVPGSVYRDLWNAGIIEDPYFGMNSLHCEWVANRWWTYETTFNVEKPSEGERLRLVFHGIDYHAHIYLNGKKIAEHIGMFVPCEIDITALACYQQENRLSVVLEQAPEEMSQGGYTSQTHTQKSRFNYKWDFGTRLVNLGLYGKVYLEKVGSARIENIYVRYHSGSIHVSVTVDGPCRLSATCSYRGVRLAEEMITVSDAREIFFCFSLDDPQLWYPNGSGEQPLYDIELTLYSLHSSSVLDEKVIRYGLKTVEYVTCKDAPKGSLPYSPVINGKQIFIKGVNLVPLDHMYGCVTREDYRRLLSKAKAMNANLIRVWGGGLIESEDFYELCDEMGFMVWQEMIQSSSGIDHTPAKDKDFLALLRKTAEYAVSQKRNHVCLTYWSGGNELMDENYVPYTFEDDNLAMLKSIIETLDPDHLMLPTSASGPVEYVENLESEDNHDVHGNWAYEGDKAHYERYNRLRVQLHSEFGVDGLSSLEALKTFLPPSSLCVTDMERDLVWRHHGEWWDTYQRDTSIFGEIKDLSDFVKISQYMQSEGLRYIIESHRRKAFRTCGCIVWQLNEPWPNVSCTNLIEYGGTPKMAAYYYRDAMKPVHISLQYDQMVWEEGDTFIGKIVPLCDDREMNPTYCVRIESDEGLLCKYEGQGTMDISCMIPDGVRCLYVICETDKDVNTYLFPIRKGKFADPQPVLRFYDEYMSREENEDLNEKMKYNK